MAVQCDTFYVVYLGQCGITTWVSLIIIKQGNVLISDIEGFYCRASIIQNYHIIITIGCSISSHACCIRPCPYANWLHKQTKTRKYCFTILMCRIFLGICVQMTTFIHVRACNQKWKWTRAVVESNAHAHMATAFATCASLAKSRGIHGDTDLR